MPVRLAGTLVQTALVAFLFLKFGNCRFSLTSTLPSGSNIVKGRDYSSGILTCTATDATLLQLFRFDNVPGTVHLVSVPVIPISNALFLTFSDSNVSTGTTDFYCEATNGSHFIRKHVVVHFDVPPDTSNVFARSNPSSGIVAEGTSFSINCSADASISPTPVIEVLHVESSSNRSIWDHELVYVVDYASKADQGRYECWVRNRQGDVTKTLPIFVLVPANVDRFTTIINVPTNNRQVEIEEGTDERLECTASGDEPLTVKLLHNSQSLNESDSSTVRAVLTSVKIGQDDGTYTCTAVNGVKTDEENLTITVYKNASVKSFNNASQCIESGAGVTLECVAEGHPTPDVRIIGPLGITLQSAKGKASYRLNRAENANGTYTCSVKNKYNTQNRTSTLRMTRKPDAPTGVQVGDDGANELKFMWTALAAHYCDADFPVRYRLQCTGGGSTPVNVIVSAPSTEHVVPESSFQSAVRYGCSVTAENAIGYSSPSNPFLLMEPSGSPGQPVVEAKSRSALVSWTAIPKEDRHGVIRNYTIDVLCISAHCQSELPLTLSSTSLQRNILGLSPNTEYSVEVRGHNMIGEGPKSMPTNFTTACSPSGVSTDLFAGLTFALLFIIVALSLVLVYVVRRAQHTAKILRAYLKNESVQNQMSENALYDEISAIKKKRQFEENMTESSAYNSPKDIRPKETSPL